MGILNKITDSNFKDLANDLVNLEIKKSEHLQYLVDMIFKKAISESKFSKLYSNLCNNMIEYHIEINNYKLYFKKFLLMKCQRMFEKGSTLSIDLIDKETGRLMTDDNKLFKFKDHVLGCIRFIGELYNCGILTEKIMAICLNKLFNLINKSKACTINCICTLLTVIGDKFHYHNNFKNYVRTLNNIKQSGKLDSKDKFEIMDLLDLAKSKNWLN